MPLLVPLFLILFTLKMLDVIAISWWLVTMPLWGGFLFWFIVYFGLFAIFMRHNR